MRATTAKAVRNRRSNRSVSLTLAAVAAQATGTPSPVVAMWYLVPRLPRSVGFGPVRSPPRLARTEQLSRIRSGSPRSIATSRACTRWSRLTAAQPASRRRRVEPLAWAGVAVRPRHGVPSRRNRRRAASTRTVSAGGCPGPGSPGPSHRSTTVAIRSKILTSNIAPLPCRKARDGHRRGAQVIKPSQPGVDVETGSYAAHLTAHTRKRGKRFASPGRFISQRLAGLLHTRMLRQCVARMILWTCPRRVEGWDQNVTRPHACRSLPCRRAPRPGCDSRGSSVAAAGYRTLRPKTHGTEAGDEAMVAYAWHPWAGQSVRVHEAIGRPTGARARCSLAGADAVRMREIPAWMLDAAACRGAREVPEPVAALSALAALRSLLTEAMRAAAVASPAHHRGDRHATPSSPAPGAAAPARTPPGGPAAGAGRGARVGRLAGSDAAGADRADGPPARRVRRRRRTDGRG